MKTILKLNNREVIYNSKDKTYIKVFKPKLYHKVRCYLGIRRFPGNNFYHISRRLSELGLKTVEVLEYSKYKAITKEKEGIGLDQYLKENNYPTEILEKYIDFVVTVLNNGIYYWDFHFGNFIVAKDQDSNEIELFALDLDGYRDREITRFYKATNHALGMLNNKLRKHLTEELYRQIFGEIEKRVHI